jgi:restriction system protein
LTEAGQLFATNNQALTKTQLRDLWTVEKGVTLEKMGPSVSETLEVTSTSSESPEERLESAVAELGESVQAELLEAVMGNTPVFFERLVLDLLHAMGYGMSRKDIEQVGKSNDGGIDGIISLDRLGLEKVYVQAKRWQNNVGRPEIQGFYGALAGQRARKGVFITTAGFSPQAVDFAKSVEGVILIDGARLTQLMIDFEVGITPRIVKVPKVDLDYFEE